jgi:prolyl-tRNA synthetase
MKDSYSFDIDAAGLDVSYKKHYQAYCAIFDRCGLKYMVVEADSGAMGGKESHEFMVRTPAGEDQIVSCDGCNYAANMEKAASKLESVEDLKPEGDGNPLEVHTPGQKTIEDVAKFLGVSPKNKIKTLALMAEEADEKGKKKLRQIVVLMRGDHQLNEAKLNATIAATPRPMEEGEIKALFKSPAGYLGPMGIEWAGDLKKDSGKAVLLVDKALEGRTNLIAGANKEDYHLKNLTPGKDFHPTAYADLRAVTAGEGCPNCGKALRIDTAVEIGTSLNSGIAIRSRWVRGCLIRMARKSRRLWAVMALGLSAF